MEERLQLYDPKAITQAKFYLKDVKVEYHSNKYEVLDKADAVVLVTEWKEFRSPDFQKMSKMMNSKILIDGRNQFSSETITNQGFEYYQIGVN